MIGLTYEELKELHPCSKRSVVVTELLGGASKWNGRKISAADAVKAGVTLDDLVWVASAKARSDKDVERRLRLWMSDCAAHVLHIYEKDDPADMRVRDCIVAARRFARGEIKDAVRDAVRAAARAAAGDAAGAAAGAAVRDAARDAARAAARDAAGAAARAAAGDAAGDAAWDAEEEWQLERLVAWLSDPEPQDWLLPDKASA